MDRPDLHSTFTKITLWKQIQFRRIVYVDADMIAIRAPDELFDIPHAFSAAPDIGWPDIFNTGLMVLSPNMGDYYALLAMAQRGISFDGADQGLLNMHFRTTYNRLSFTYNVTPSAHYQYLPAYRHFQSSISMGHFIGPTKPWTQGREANRGSTPYDEMVGRWWAVYDRHYRESVCRSRPCVAVILTSSKSVQPAAEPSAPLVQYHVKGEFHPVSPIISSSKASQSEGIVSEILLPATEEPLHETTEIVEEAKVVEQVEAVPALPVQSIPQKEEEREPQYSSWDASKSVIVTSLNLK
jgi:glycogenin glucosyltransferase